ncbi:hypothetical protein LCGC14_2138850 [marine sediment metagenome]|uniref:Uncharacterized protein n=1 Tax=marine sediment metagenome TaxID=412755 RepID=A0A0F9DZ86_9ZZZZ
MYQISVIIWPSKNAKIFSVMTVKADTALDAIAQSIVYLKEHPEIVPEKLYGIRVRELTPRGDYTSIGQ